MARGEIPGPLFPERHIIRIEIIVYLIQVKNKFRLKLLKIQIYGLLRVAVSPSISCCFSAALRLASGCGGR